MTIWYFVLALLLISSTLEVCGQKNVLVAKNVSFNLIVFFYLSLFLLLLASLRFETGRDWKNYLHMYHYDNPETSFTESGYIRMNVFFRNLNLGDKGFYLMQFIIMTFCCGVIYRNIYENNEFPIFILLVYFTSYFFSTELAQTRQHIAMAILICGNKFIRDKKFILWILVVILAMQFHITAIMAFPLYFTDRIRLSSPVAFILLFLALALNLAGFNLVWTMLNVAVGLSFIPERIAGIMKSYMNSSIYGQQGQYSTGLGLLCRYVFYFVFIFLWSLKGKDERKKYHLTNFLIAVYFTSLGRNFDQFSRIANYYFICGSGLSLYNTLPSSITFFKKLDVTRIALVAFYSLFIIFSFYMSWMSEYEYSYQTVLFHQF